MSAMVDHLIAEIFSLNVKLLACHARLAASTDSEALHDLRTTVRRLRSVLRPLRGLPGMDQIEEAAKGVGDLTTPLRDMQVLAAFLSEQGLDRAARKRTTFLDAACPNVATSAELNRLFGVLDQLPSFLRAQQRKTFVIGCRSGTVGMADDLEHGAVQRFHRRAHIGQLRRLVGAQRGAVEIKGDLDIDLGLPVNRIVFFRRGGHGCGFLRRVLSCGCAAWHDHQAAGLLFLEGFGDFLNRQFAAG